MLSEIISFLIFAFGLVLFALSIGSGKSTLKGILYMALGGAIALVFKVLLFDERPCSGDLFCPFDSGVISGHTITAMMFALAFYNKKEFIIFLGIAILVALSRIYFGFHDINQVAKSIGLSILAYYMLGVMIGGTHKKD